jgi:hypothetical protein
MFSFSATAPQLDSLPQRVNEIARQNSNANGHLIEDSQDSRIVPFSTGNPGSFLCPHCPVVLPGGSTESFDKGMGTEECGFESRNHCLSLFLRDPQFLRPPPTAGCRMNDHLEALFFNRGWRSPKCGIIFRWRQARRLSYDATVTTRPVSIE